MRFALETLGVQQVDRELVGMSARAVDVSGAMGDVFKLLFKAQKKQFDTEGAYGSGGWRPLAASTLAYKRANNLDMRILRATGDLFEAMTSKADTTVAAPKRDGFVFGTTLEYAKYHQLGRGVPKRPVVELRENDRREIMKILQRYVVEGRGL